jgi:hypothetical protein
VKYSSLSSEEQRTWYSVEVKGKQKCVRDRERERERERESPSANKLKASYRFGESGRVHVALWEAYAFCLSLVDIITDSGHQCSNLFQQPGACPSQPIAVFLPPEASEGKMYSPSSQKLRVRLELIQSSSTMSPVTLDKPLPTWAQLLLL